MRNLNTTSYAPERIAETLDTLEAAKRREDAILVSFSGGKDSLAVLDMCCRTFSRVEAFFMYLVPSVRVAEDLIDAGAARWGVKVHRVPHWVSYRALQCGTYCDAMDDVPDVNLRDVYRVVMDATGVRQVAVGARRTEGIWRRHDMQKTEGWEETVYPIAAWSRLDVLSYLGSRGIPVPAAAGGEANGIGLNTSTVLWLYDMHREDYERVRKVFPYVESIVKRRDFYGVGQRYGKVAEAARQADV